MPHPERGEVWSVDLGMVAKVRPCLLLTNWPADEDLALITVLAHTTTLRGSVWEHRCRTAFLREGAFHLQQIHSVPIAKLVRKLGLLSAVEFGAILDKVRTRLKL